MQITEILNGPDTISMQGVERALPPAYDSIFNPNSSGEPVNPGTPGTSRVEPDLNYGWKN
jgi:hypothetical protein